MDGRTDGRTDVRTGGRTFFPSILLGRLSEVDLIKTTNQTYTKLNVTKLKPGSGHLLYHPATKRTAPVLQLWGPTIKLRFNTENSTIFSNENCEKMALIS